MARGADRFDTAVWTHLVHRGLPSVMRSAPVSFRAESFRGKSVRLPVAAELLSLCVAKEKVTKEKGHPAWRLPGILPGKSVSRGRAFRTGSCPCEKESTSCRLPLRGLSTPPHRRTGAPGRAAGHPGPHSVMKLKSRSHSKAPLCCGFALALDLALLKSARWERAALPGVPMARRVGGGKPAGWPAGMPASFSPARDVLSKNPAAHPRTRRAGDGMDAGVEATQGAVARCPQGAPSGWPLFWLLFSGHPEKSDSPSEGGRKLFARGFRAHQKQQARASRPNSHTQPRRPTC